MFVSNYTVKIDRCIEEFDVWIVELLPYAKMKVKVYQEFYKTNKAHYIGYTNIRIKRKFDGQPQGGVGFGDTKEEALDNTLENFIEIFNDDYSNEERPEGLLEEDIEYMDPSVF